MIVLNNSNKSNKIDEIGEKYDSGEYSKSNVYDRLADLGVALVSTREELPYENCLGWAFGQIGLPKYKAEQLHVMYCALKTGSIEELELVQDIIEYDLVA